METKSVVLDDILQVQARHETQAPLIGYPRGCTVADFELFTARDLDVLVERAAKSYALLPIDPVEEPIVSLVGPSDLDYLVTKFALSRLGFGVLLLSTRLTPEACLKLLDENQCRIVIQSPSKLSYDLGARTQEVDASVAVYPIATSNVYRDDRWDSKPLIRKQLDPDTASQRTAIVYHSSGSTGLPKSIATSHEKLLSPIPTANADIPSTADTLVEVCRAVEPHVFLTVPYILKLLAETEAGVQELVKCRQVVSSGSQLSDDLGNRLVREGVNVETLFAGTEPGMVGSSMNRPAGDHAWDYIRLVPAVQQNVQYKPLGGNTFEFVYLESLPTLNMSNSNDPPGSFHSSDILTPHPTIPNAWKYIGRIDDRVTLSTGEKVLPLPLEGFVRQNALVREAVVFGINRAIPGLLVFRAQAAKDLSDDEFVSKIWPVIEEANTAAEAFGRIDRDMVVILPADVHIPAADKESIIRAKVYKLYEQQIESAYERMEKGSEGGLLLSLPDLEQYLLRLVKNEVGIQVSDVDADFHQAGMDSLQAIRLRGMILKNISVGTQPLSQNVVFESGNVRRLAHKITQPDGQSRNCASTEVEELALMEEFIDKYTTFVPRTFNDTTEDPPKHTFLLTGATGSLGAHILSQLLSDPNIAEIYCIVRAPSSKARVLYALESRNLYKEGLASKVKLIEGDLARPDFVSSLPESLRTRLTHIVHAAWPVNFQISLRAFEPHIRGLHTLLQVAQSVSGPASARLLFCSSISVALGTPAPASIPEASIPSLKQAQGTGYAQSKLVGEKIVERAVLNAGANACILRIGQVVGDTDEGIWNDSEAWPLIIRSALTLGVLPSFDMTCSWLPVNTLASSILDIAGRPNTPTTLNLENDRRFHWTRDLFPTLQTAGLAFEPVHPQEWLRQLTHYQSSVTAEEVLTKNPAVKLFGYFEQLVRSTAVCDVAVGCEMNGDKVIVFETTKARECSAHLSTAPDVLGSGLVDKFLKKWMQEWTL